DPRMAAADAPKASFPAAGDVAEDGEAVTPGSEGRVEEARGATGEAPARAVTPLGRIATAELPSKDLDLRVARLRGGFDDVASKDDVLAHVRGRVGANFRQTERAIHRAREVLGKGRAGTARAQAGEGHEHDEATHAQTLLPAGSARNAAETLC